MDGGGALVGSSKIQRQRIRRRRGGGASHGSMARSGAGRGVDVASRGSLEGAEAWWCPAGEQWRGRGGGSTAARRC